MSYMTALQTKNLHHQNLNLISEKLFILLRLTARHCRMIILFLKIHGIRLLKYITSMANKTIQLDKDKIAILYESGTRTSTT